MALSAQLFYTSKVYPKEIITNKHSIPDDPDERLKDKVFMSVVFTIKWHCKYKAFILPETRFEEDIKATEKQMDEIFASLGNKYQMEFRKRKFKTVGELTIYVKDHRGDQQKDK